ncbi:Nudix hydrolase 15, mitochondrial [Actinomortierella ambigua]|uniref:Nudix hydrolase 15, mitochondrial n=1 Tax=Actinomortierella ambigua TaxID=1343610 RepID=A0A9P6PYC1_9FUNG|nr:Nudix hydrolase 15, mitochondrial [Actinomortierella ambigua]
MTTGSTSAPSEGIVQIGIGVFIRRNGKILVGKRIGSHGAGTWQLSGGHLDFGETFEECAIRETLEETGLNLNPATARVVSTVNNLMLDEGKHYVVIFVAAECIDDNQEAKVMEPHKCEQWAWITLDELKDDNGPYRPLFSPLRDLMASNDLRPLFVHPSASKEKK